jgi:hypothetical protein
MKTRKNCDFALYPINIPPVKLRFEVLLKEFHPRINLTTLFFTKTYLRNSFKLLLGHENWSLRPEQHNLKNLSEVATLRILSIKILSMRYIKLAQMTPGARISAF